MRVNQIALKNLASLRRHHPAIHEELVGNADSLPCKNQSSFTIDPNATETEPSPLHPSDSVRNPSFLDSILASLESGMDFLYLMGLDDGNLLLRSAPRIVDENRGILVIEPSLKTFNVALQTADLRHFFASKKMYWAIGNHVREKIARIFDASLCYAAARPHFHWGRFPLCADEKKMIDSHLVWIRNEVRQRYSRMKNKIETLPSILGNRNASSPRVWSFQDLRDKACYSLIQHVLMRTLMHHFRRLGYETEYTVLQSDHYYPPYYRILKMALFEPDLIFLCNEPPGFESGLGRAFSRSLPIPKIVWFADDPLYGEHLLQRHGTSADETYLIADYEWADTLRLYGVDSPDYMPGAATKIRRGKKRGSRRCDIVFVGQVRDLSPFFEQLSPAWQSYCRRVIAEKMRFPRKKVRDVMAGFEPPGELPADRLDELRQKLLWQANTQFRLHVIQSLSRFDLRIYGNEDWLKLLPAEAANKWYRGILRFKHLFEVYRNAKITLNIHSLQSYTCMNVRDFDVPAAGGFLLSDWLPKADEIYCPGFVNDLPLSDEAPQEVFFYRSLPELAQLAAYFLEHEEQRSACIERARRKVLEKHTYAHRAEWLDHLFEEKLQNEKA
ncbi:MAG: glycosyltransferase family 1 protein [Candidatus Omnitrophota bacterium]|jgi:spore maturation protein CgeB|nr:MAG: glycosyltransferase family 1 protein [Candidatus Omnitrophota bacterium]